MNISGRSLTLGELDEAVDGINGVDRRTEVRVRVATTATAGTDLVESLAVPGNPDYVIDVEAVHAPRIREVELDIIDALGPTFNALAVLQEFVEELAGQTVKNKSTKLAVRAMEALEKAQLGDY